MNEFILLFRRDLKTESRQPTKEQMVVYMRQWMEWIGEISESGRLADGGNHLLDSGRLLRSGASVNEDIYVADGASVTGYIIVLSHGIDEATAIALKCPLLNGEGNSVEIRQAAAPI